MSRIKTPKDLSASVVVGSEEVFDYFCQPCSSEQHLEAVGYCQDCSQYLCITCIKYHGKLAGTSHHKVLDKSAMPKTKIPQKAQYSDVLTEKCQKHPDEILKYFCQTHKQICCSVCITVHHNVCSNKSDIVYIPDVSGDIANSKEYTILKTDLQHLIGEITKRLEHINNDSKNNDKCHVKTLTDIKAFRKQINEQLDRIEEDTKRKVAKFHQENIGILKSASEKCQSLLTEVNSMAVDIDKITKAGKNNHLFAQVQLSRSRIAEVEKQMRVRHRVTKYTFAQDEKIKEMMSSLSDLWSQSLRQDETLSAISPQAVRQDVTPNKARYVREVIVKVKGDANDSCITGMALLTNGRMAMTDFSNKTVKLIDMKANQLLFCLPLSSEPFDITVMEPGQVAVTLGNEAKIEIIAVSNILSLSHTIKKPNAGMVGLCYTGSNFIIACQDPGCIIIISMSGETLKTFSTDSHGKQLYTKPRSVVLSCDKDVVYISDQGADAVTSLTLSSHAITVYRHAKLKSPFGVAVGKDGAVYVCSPTTHTIHQLSPTGDHIRIILDLDQGLTHFPKAIVYDDKDDMLYISSNSVAPEECNKIQIYQLE